GVELPFLKGDPRELAELEEKFGVYEQRKQTFDNYEELLDETFQIIEENPHILSNRNDYIISNNLVQSTRIVGHDSLDPKGKKSEESYNGKYEFTFKTHDYNLFPNEMYYDQFNETYRIIKEYTLDNGVEGYIDKNKKEQQISFFESQKEVGGQALAIDSTLKTSQLFQAYFKYFDLETGPFTAEVILDRAGFNVKKVGKLPLSDDLILKSMNLSVNKEHGEELTWSYGLFKRDDEIEVTLSIRQEEERKRELDHLQTNRYSKVYESKFEGEKKYSLYKDDFIYELVFY